MCSSTEAVPETHHDVAPSRRSTPGGKPQTAEEAEATQLYWNNPTRVIDKSSRHTIRT